MSTLLYIKINPKSDATSYSAQLAQVFLDAYTAAHSEDQVELLDLYRSDIPFLDVDVFSAWGKFASHDELTPTEIEKVQRMNELTDQFLRADKIVFSSPFWNLSFPPMMKAYIDTICVAGKTFKYTDHGPVGLVPDKPVLLIEARGGHYSSGPAEAMQFSEKYLRTIICFMGMKNFQSLVMEGLSIDPAASETILAEYADKARSLAASF